MSPDEFIKSYESALKSQEWENVAPLFTNQVSVTFSNGTVHRGKEEVRKAFQNNFQLIKNEDYRMDQISWLIKEKTHAVYLFEYHWSGLVNGKLISGNGIGTSVIINDGNGWLLLTEHLSKKST